MNVSCKYVVSNKVNMGFTSNNDHVLQFVLTGIDVGDDGSVNVVSSGKGSGANPVAALLDADLDDLWGNRAFAEDPKKSSSKRAVAVADGEPEESHQSQGSLDHKVWEI